MKKRILSILLLCCMVLTLLPTAAFAADTGKAIQLGTDALSKNVNTASAPTVYFGQDHENNPAAWRVIGYNGNGVASAQGDMTLLAAGNMSSVLQFADFGTNNRYASSYLKTAIDALAEKLTTEENTAVKKRTLTSGSYNGENTDCVAGEQVDNAVFWPLSTAEAFAVNQDLRIVDPEHPSWASSYWWLRSPGYSDHDAATVNGDGSVVYSGNAISSWWCVRPAFNLNSSSVLFTSAAVGGKPDGGLTPISKYTGNEWKLTLKDSNRNFAVTETTVSGDPGDTVTLHYTGATAGINEYISVILADNSGAQYYGRVAQPTAENGTVEIKIPSGLAPGSYTLKVFSEQCNDDKKTDYASDFVDIDLTVGYQEQFTLTPGGVYYFDLSGVSIPGTANGSLPDKTMHYVPFTYAGTVDAYKLTSEMATTEEYAQQNEYAHSLFVADYAVTHAVSWDDLNATGLIFGKGYATGSVDYTLRAPSGGSGGTGSGDSERGTPQSNEWDRILDKDDGYIKNWRNIGSWGQDTLPNTLSNRVIRGRYDLPRKYAGANTTLSFKFLGFRPVLEVLNSDTLGSDGLKAVTLDLGGGKFGGSSDTIQIIVKTGESFTAPASDGLTRPDGNTGSYFMWRDNDGQLYAPGDNVPVDVTKLTAQFVPPEQFTLAPGGTYYFDLSGVSIPGTVNDALPDNTLHYVPFTYAGTVDAYKLTSEMATTEEYAEQNKYAHSLFVADYTVTHTISWNDLNTAGLIFGKGYAAGGVDYTLRAPSAGSSSTGPSFSIHGAPQSNEWDRILDKDERYIQNIVGLYSWGQDTPSASASQRVGRGYYPLRGWSSAPASYQTADAGFRPVLEVLGLDKLGYDGLKAVTLDLGGGTLGGSSEDIQIIVKNSSVFTAPASNGLTRPDGDTGSYFKWLGSDGELYEPGDSVSADVTRLTAQFVLIEQFRLAPGGTYYFDLSAMSIPGTVNSNLPDQTMHYVPFTYVGIVDAYKLTSETATTEEYAEKNKYPHSLFVADYAVTGAVNWNVLNNASLIFGKDYAAGGVDYMLRAPSVGSGYTGQDELQRRTPQSNEWDRILDKNDGYIKNWSEGYSWGQDTSSASSSHRGIRWNGSSHKWASADTKFSLPALRFHPVLEVLSPGTLGPDGLKAVTLDLGGGKLGGSSQDIQIIVKSGESFTAPASDGLTRPDGDTGSYFKWLGSDGNLYAPGDSVPANVNKLTAQFAPSSHSVTITTDTLPDGKVGEAYSQTLTATGTAPITWSIDGGLPAGLSLNADTGEISGTPTADGTAKFTVKATNSAGSNTKELSITIAKAAPTEYTVTVTSGGNGTASASHAKAVVGTEIRLTAKPDEGYRFKEWQVISGGVTIKDDKFTMPDSDVEVKAIFEEDAPPAPTDPAKPSISVTGTYTYNGSVHTATVNGYDPTTMDISGNTATDAGDYTVSVTSNTGKWADDSTDAVTAEWSIGKATQEAPNGLIGVAPTTEGGSDGKITGVDSTMEYRMAGESSYTACSGTEIENLSAGNYFVRYAEDNNHFAGTDAEVTVGKGAPLADCTITFDGNGGSGSMGPVTVKAGTNYTLPDCGFTAPADQEFKAWEIGGTEYEVGNFYTVNGDTEIKALWENSVITPTTYTVTVNNDGNGTASATPSAAEALTEITLTAKPDEGYRFKEWEVISGGVSIKDDKFTMPSANVEVKAIFEKDAPTEFTITFDGNGGTPSVGSMTTANQKLTSLPSASRSGSYSFDGWYTKKSGGTKVTTATVFSANTTVYAHWTYTGGGGSSGYSYYTIKATAGAGGSISPSGNVSVREGRDQTFTITPDKGYAVANVKIDGKSIGAVKSYTFENVRRTHTIEVIFMKANGNPQTGVFVDVATGSYYEDAVDWAVENGITKGTDDTHFSPDGICTRVQAVTFLWRAAGSPKPETRTMPFTDVPVGSYYYDAVLWAVENGITMGTSDTTFSPNATCSRAQIVAFLWRSEKSPAAGTANPFADVKSDAYYADAVLWAVKENITKGTTSTTFSPNADCTRAQIVTFLWRCKK